MSKHVVTVFIVRSKIWSRDGKPSLMRRWECSCGRIGPERHEHDQAVRGGAQHVRAKAGRR